jgi:tetratricopeptide (TPR) repeat protein
LYAQFSFAPAISVPGELRSRSDTGSSDFLIEIYDARTNAFIQRVPVSSGVFQLDSVPAGSYAVRLVTAPGGPALVEEYHQFEPGGAPLILDLPERATANPISGVVSVRELRHPIPKKAFREAFQGQQFARANDLPKAIAKFENAIRIDPDFRNAHCNLGLLYARAGRGAEALAELKKAIDIGPPAAPIYADFALISFALGQRQEAAAFARKALELDPANGGALSVLKLAEP